MKYFFLMTLIAFGAQAGDGKLCDHLKKNTFKDHSSSFGVDFKSELGKVIARVSNDLSKKVEEQCKSGSLWAVKDFDTCSSFCLANGSPNYGGSGGKGITEISRACQGHCKSYQLAAFAFQDGMRSLGDEGQHKCGAGVNNSETDNKSDLVEKVKQQVKIQKDASNQ